MVSGHGRELFSVDPVSRKAMLLCEARPANALLPKFLQAAELRPEKRCCMNASALLAERAFELLQEPSLLSQRTILGSIHPCQAVHEDTSSFIPGVLLPLRSRSALESEVKAQS